VRRSTTFLLWIESTRVAVRPSARVPVQDRSVDGRTAERDRSRRGLPPGPWAWRSL